MKMINKKDFLFYQSYNDQKIGWDERKLFHYFINPIFLISGVISFF